MSIRKVASIASIALGALMIIAAAATWWMVTAELDDQEIVTPEDACLPERQVRGPFTAWCSGGDQYRTNNCERIGFCAV